jgi:anti-sigma factor RsiW
MRSTHPFEQEEVMAYLDGEISADRASEIAEHMQKCAECRELAAALRNLSRELAAWEVEASPEQLSDEMNAQIAVAGTQSKRAASAPVELTPLQRFAGLVSSREARPWIWAGAAAMVTILFFVTIGRPNLFTAHKVPLWASREAELQAVQRQIEEERVASSLENSPINGRSVTGLAPLVPAAPAPPRSMPTQASASPATSPMIARTASLSLVVKDFGGVEAAVKGVTMRHSGYIGELNTSTPPDSAKTLSATLRVPSAQLEPALAELKQLGRADQESQAGEEVTKQYTDLAARLKNSRATEQRLLDVLRNNTGKVKDVLEVQNEISRVRGEIEGMEADQRALQTRIDFATITFSVTEGYKASVNGASSSTGTRLHNAFVTGYHSLVENVIGLLAWLLESGPTLLLWAALLFFPIRWVWRRARRALTNARKPVAAQA